jgi:hypothetical protein
MRIAAAVRARESRYPGISASGRRARSMAISPSSPGTPLTGSMSAIAYPGSGRPIEPSLIGWPGELPTSAVVSGWP